MSLMKRKKQGSTSKPQHLLPVVFPPAWSTRLLPIYRRMAGLNTNIIWHCSAREYQGVCNEVGRGYCTPAEEGQVSIYSEVPGICECCVSKLSIAAGRDCCRPAEEWQV